MEQQHIRLDAADLEAEMQRNVHGAVEMNLLQVAADVQRRHGRGPYVVRLDFPDAVDGGGLTITCRLMSWPAKLVWVLCRKAARLWA